MACKMSNDQILRILRLLRRLDELRKSGVLTQQEYEERVALLKKQLQVLSSKRRCPRCGSENIVGYENEYECMDCGYKFVISQTGVQERSYIPIRRPLGKKNQENRHNIKTISIVAATFLVGMLIGYLFLGFVLPHPSSTMTSVSPIAGQKVTQCVEWPKSGSWAFYRLDAVLPFASGSGWIRIYSNGTHVFAAMLFGGNYTLKTRSVSEFSSEGFMSLIKVNITKPVFIGEELVMTLKPMKAAVYQEATGNYTRKIYLDETTKLPILILFEAPNPSSLPVSISVSLAETNICQLQ